MRIMILGCGPAGLLSAHAAETRGHDVTVVSERPQPSRLGGAQYLHCAVPGVTAPDPETEIAVIRRGGRSGYAFKVYGDAFADVSWDRYADMEVVPGWNLIEAYRRLWSTWSMRVQQKKVTRDNLRGLTHGYDMVVSTIPKKILCQRPIHKFRNREVWAAAVSQDLPETEGVENFIAYSGLHADWFYRTSHLFGTSMTEWSTVAFPTFSGAPHEDAFIIQKPLSNNCDCVTDERFVFAGRYGRWDKGQLVSDVWDQVNAVL